MAISQLGTSISILPQMVNLMTHTATATSETQRTISDMDSPVYIADIFDRYPIASALSSEEASSLVDNKKYNGKSNHYHNCLHYLGRVSAT